MKILFDCINFAEDKKLLKYNIKQILDINYVFYLLSQPDVFINIDSPKAILNTCLKSQLYLILNEVWLSIEGPSQYIFKTKKYLTDFLNYLIRLLKNLTRIKELELPHKFIKKINFLTQS